MRASHLIAFATLLAARSALAGDAFVTGDVDLRAGPDGDYPKVASLHANTPVAIQGCVKNWSWCDVATTTGRGWIAGDFLEQEYEGHRVVVTAFGKQAGIPTVAFAFDTYWRAHYKQQAFYAERARYAKVKPRYAPPMRKPIEAPAPTQKAQGTPHATPVATLRDAATDTTSKVR